MAKEHSGTHSKYTRYHKERNNKTQGKYRKLEVIIQATKRNTKLKFTVKTYWKLKKKNISII